MVALHLDVARSFDTVDHEILVYVNDLSLLELKGTRYSFADDNAIAYSARSKELFCLLTQDMNHILHYVGYMNIDPTRTSLKQNL